MRGWLAAGGRVQRIKEKQTTVRMVRETVAIDLHPSHYDVIAVFIFKNDGPAVTVQMGFPERGYGDAGPEDTFIAFRTWVDGGEVQARRKIAHASEDDFLAYRVKDVAFAAGQTRTVKVQYRSPFGNDVSGLRWASYDFTGGNWAGAVEESTLLVTVDIPGATLAVPNLPMRHRENRLATRWTNWQAEFAFSIHFYLTRPDSLIVPGFAAHHTFHTGPHGYLIVNPGAPAPDRDHPYQYLPAGILKDGTPHLALAAVTEHMRRQAPFEKRREAVLFHWDAAANLAVLEANGRRLEVGIKQTTIRVDGQDVALPARTFLSLPVRLPFEDAPRSLLFAPAVPIVEALGGTVRYDPETRRLNIGLPLQLPPDD
jgi:hypothetical protein